MGMNAKLLTILFASISVVGYQIVQRSMPTGSNPFTLVAIAYALGILFCALLAPIFGRPIGLEDAALLRQWQIWGLAVSIVCIEVGYLLTYRAGWSLATTTSVTYTSSMMVLAAIGAVFFSEDLSLRKVAGLALATIGLWMLVTPPRGG